MLSNVRHVQLFATLWPVASHAPPGDLSNQGIEPGSLMFPVLAGGFFTISTTLETSIHSYKLNSIAISI